jgi:site-specific DNA recombinase
MESNMDIHKKAIVYVRVSTDRQIDNFSVADQRNMKDVALRYGFETVEVVEEQGVSGESLVNRAMMRQILEEIESGIVGALVVTSFSRISRDEDGIDGRLVKKSCRDNDCVIITPDKIYDFSNEMDDDLSEFQFLFAKMQKRMNLKPMMKGQYLKAKDTGFAGLPLSVGYDYEWYEVQTNKGPVLKARLKVNEDEAKTVRLVHDLFPNMLHRQIAEHLNRLAQEGKGQGFPIKY